MLLYPLLLYPWFTVYIYGKGGIGAEAEAEGGRREQNDELMNTASSFLDPGRVRRWHHRRTRTGRVFKDQKKKKTPTAIPTTNEWYAKMEAQSEHVSVACTFFPRFGTDSHARSVLINKISGIGAQEEVYWECVAGWGCQTKLISCRPTNIASVNLVMGCSKGFFFLTIRTAALAY